MSIIQAIILSIVEGLSEFLPISSTGHLIIASRLLGLESSNFVKSFEIIIQLGAILAVVVLYWRLIWTQRQLWKLILIAFIPSVIIGLLGYEFIKTYLFDSPNTVAVSLIVGGVFLIGLEKFLEKRRPEITGLDRVSNSNALIIGFGQVISMIPGISRSGATISAGLLQGIDRKTAVEFSFLLSIPTMFAATSLDLLKYGQIFSNSEYMVLSIGFVGAFISALLAVKWFVKYVSSHGFIWFGVYRIIFGVIILLSNI